MATSRRTLGCSAFHPLCPMTAAIGHLLQLPASFIDQATPLTRISSQDQGDAGVGPQHITDRSPEGNGIRQVPKTGPSCSSCSCSNLSHACRSSAAATAAPSAAEVLPTCITCGELQAGLMLSQSVVLPAPRRVLSLRGRQRSGLRESSRAAGALPLGLAPLQCQAASSREGSTLR